MATASTATRFHPHPSNPMMPKEHGGQCCGGCGCVLAHKDYLGVKSAGVFRVFGYRCSRCGHEWRQISGVLVPFRWVEMPVPGLNSHTMKLDPYGR